LASQIFTQWINGLPATALLSQCRVTISVVEVRIMSTDKFMFDRFMRDVASRAAYSPEPDR